MQVAAVVGVERCCGQLCSSKPGALVQRICLFLQMTLDVRLAVRQALIVESLQEAIRCLLFRILHQVAALLLCLSWDVASCLDN